MKRLCIFCGYHYDSGVDNGACLKCSIRPGEGERPGWTARMVAQLAARVTALEQKAARAELSEDVE